jgi:threonylcarbamoyladenosine tRNA methylthiotransferase MtaB
MKTQYFHSLHAGQTRKVLFESGRDNGMMEGYTDNYIKVTTPFRQDYFNEIIDWNI